MAVAHRRLTLEWLMNQQSLANRAPLVITLGLLLMTSAQDTAAGPESPAPLPQASPRLMILRDTGVMRTGLPVLEEHGADVESQLEPQRS